MTEKYTFKLDEKVERLHVNYPNRYGITIAADLYCLKAENSGLKKPALVVGPPYGGVKEQGPGVYANELAKRGFVVLAFDPAFMGESGGTPRHTSSPDIFVENFSASVDYLSSLPFVDPEKIGAIGLCGSGGFALAAAQADTRIKAVATASLYDISTVDRESLTARQLFELKVSLNRQRQRDFENGEPEYLPSFPEAPSETVPDGLDPIAAEFYSYYGTKRGHHPRARGNFTTTSKLAMLNFNLLTYIREIAPRPILLIVGDRAHSRSFSEKVWAAAAAPKELFVVPDAIHIDLYDRVDKIPFAKIENFFKNSL